ncbi:MAG TPA: XrtA system polysaccharide deacetylase [Vicinamibacterales bacterium]|jgi:polysaccharide deacetylase family protein (PEP-CTERM system associated)
MSLLHNGRALMEFAPAPGFRVTPLVEGGGDPDSTGDARVVNAMTIDVEDYFQVSAFEDRVPRAQWDRLESRVCRNTERLLEMFADADVTATFFVLGWVADRFPGLVRQIAEGGHEIASHGYSHRLVYSMTPSEFRDDLRRARVAIEAAASVPVLGYRAPSYSITRKSLWALDVLIAEGYAYDASIYPVHHDRYGIADWPRQIQRIETPSGGLWELPGSTVRFGSTNFPIGGGGYFRILPYAWTRHGIGRLNATERQPAVFYLHPWEIDPDQPRIASGGLSRMRHYRNLSKTQARLERLLSEFRFGPVGEVLARANALESAEILVTAGALQQT